MTLAILVAGGLAVTWLVVRPNPVALEIDGEPIVNADTVVADAEAVFRRIVDGDGAHPPAGAGCWFASSARPGAKAPPSERPRMACGPVRLGVSSGDEVWIVGSPSFSPAGAGASGWTGRFTGFRGVDAVDAGSLSRPDGADPPAATGLAPPDAVLRDSQGRRLTGERAVLESVERAVRPAAERAGASIDPAAACWFGYRTDGEGRLVSDNALWCGPLLLSTSSRDEPWARLPVSVQLAGDFATAQLRAAALTSISGTQQLRPGTQLWRPDGRRPPERVDLPVPPRTRPGTVPPATSVLPTFPTTVTTGTVTR